MRKIQNRVLLSAFALCLAAAPSHAALIGPDLVKAFTVFDQTGTLTYVASSGLMTINATGILIQFNGAEILLANGPSTLTIKLLVNGSGNFAGGVSGPDLTLTGTIDLDNDGINEYDGTLLTADAVAFGFQDDAGSTDLFDFKFKVTGGELAGVYGKYIGIALTSENSNFANNFCVNFNGGAKGTIGNLEGSKCARSPSYWKCNYFPNNIQSLTVGGVTYNRQQLINMLDGKKPNGGDAGRDPNVKLARFVITAKLSLLAGARASGNLIADLAEADAYLAHNPPGSDEYGCNDSGTALGLKDALKYWVEEADCDSPCDKDDWDHKKHGKRYGNCGW